MSLSPVLFPVFVSLAETTASGGLDHNNISSVHFDPVTTRKFRFLAIRPLYPVPAPRTVCAGAQAHEYDNQKKN